jgi:hypothetical protein
MYEEKIKFILKVQIAKIQKLGRNLKKACGRNASFGSLRRANEISLESLHKWYKNYLYYINSLYIKKISDELIIPFY